MKIIALILSLLLLTSCSNPDTSGGVTLSRGGGDDANEFPNGSCEGQHENTPDLNTGCGWTHIKDKSYYIMPGADLSYRLLWYAKLEGANLSGANLQMSSLVYANLRNVTLHLADLVKAYLVDADLTDADLRGADLRYANLSGANLSGVIADSYTICPDGKRWGTAGNNCPF